LIPKYGPLGRRPGPGKDGQNNAKIPLLVTFPPEILKPKMKKILFISSSRLAESVEGLNSSIAQSPGELWLCKIFKNCKKVAHTGLKGLKLFQYSFCFCDDQFELNELTAIAKLTRPNTSPELYAKLLTFQAASCSVERSCCGESRTWKRLKASRQQCTFQHGICCNGLPIWLF